MSQEEISSIQNEANKLVFEGRRVHVEVEELDRTQIAPNTTLNGRAVGKSLPEDYTGGVKRIVVIDGVDRNPCCGTHLPSLYNLQLFLLPHTDALSRSNTTNARLYFLAGPRLIAYITSSHDLLTNAATILSCGNPQVPQRVAQVVSDRRTTEKRLSDVETELAQHLAGDFIREITLTTGVSYFTRHLHRLDDSTIPLTFLSAIAHAFSGMVQPDGIPYLIVLTSSPSSQSTSSTTTVFVFSSDDKRVKLVGEELKGSMGVRGGGKGAKWSGKYVGVWRAKESQTMETLLTRLQQ